MIYIYSHIIDKYHYLIYIKQCNRGSPCKAHKGLLRERDEIYHRTYSCCKKKYYSWGKIKIDWLIDWLIKNLKQQKVGTVWHRHGTHASDENRNNFTRCEDSLSLEVLSRITDHSSAWSRWSEPQSMQISTDLSIPAVFNVSSNDTLWSRGTVIVSVKVIALTKG